MDKATSNPEKVEDGAQTSCDPNLTREEFLKRAAKTVLTGSAVVLGVRVLDKFLVPPAYAKISDPAVKQTLANFDSGTKTSGSFS